MIQISKKVAEEYKVYKKFKANKLLMFYMSVITLDTNDETNTLVRYNTIYELMARVREQGLYKPSCLFYNERDFVFKLFKENSTGIYCKHYVIDEYVYAALTKYFDKAEDMPELMEHFYRMFKVKHFNSIPRLRALAHKIMDLSIPKKRKLNEKLHLSYSKYDNQKDSRLVPHTYGC